MKKSIKIFIKYIILITILICQIILAKDKPITYEDYTDFNIKILDIEKCKFFYDNYSHDMYQIKKEKLYKLENDKFEIILDLDPLLNKTNQAEIKNILIKKKYLIIQTIRNKIFVINLNTKSIMWMKEFKERMLFKPIISKKKLIIDRDGDIIFALNIKNGLMIWNYWHIAENTKVSRNTKIKCDKKYIYYAYSNKRLLILNKRTGIKLRSFTTDFEKDNSFINSEMPNKVSDIVTTNKNIFVCYENNIFMLVNAKSNKILNVRTNFDYRHLKVRKKSLIIIDKKQYIKNINKFNLDHVIWKNTQLHSLELTKPKCIDYNTILFGDDDGNIHFFDIKNGILKKSIRLSREKIIKIISKINKNKIYVFIKDKFLIIEHV